MNNSKRLTRSKTDQVVAGVCGGLGKYFDIDPVLFRLLFVVITLAGGAGVLLYLVMWVIIPEESSATREMEATIKENAAEIKAKAEDFAKGFSKGEPSNHRVWVGVAVIALGVYFLLGSLGVRLVSFNLIWPAMIILLGIYLIFKSTRNA